MRALLQPTRENLLLVSRPLSAIEVEATRLRAALATALGEREQFEQAARTSADEAAAAARSRDEAHT